MECLPISHAMPRVDGARRYLRGFSQRGPEPGGCSCAVSTAGISAPVVPGIMPASNFAQIARFSAMCGASVPAWLGRMFEGTENETELRRMIGMVVAAEQMRLLQANGVDEFHFYTLNRPELTFAIAHLLGCRAG